MPTPHSPSHSPLRAATPCVGVLGGLRHELSGFLIETAKALDGCVPDSDDEGAPQGPGVGNSTEVGGSKFILSGDYEKLL